MIRVIVSPFLLGLVLALGLVPVCRLVAGRLGFVARPREDRWHRRPVALFGGIGIAASVFISAGVFHLVGELPVLIITAALTFGVGLVDDIVVLKPSTKLVAQIALASVLLFFDYHLNWLNSSTLDSLLTLVWIVGLTNAFNLLDNMDGLCAGVALIVGVALLIDLLPGAAGTRAVFEVRYLATLLGATAGFLFYNWHPATIFMGDSGTLLIGFSIAAVALSSGHQPGRSDVLSIVAAPVLVMLIPIFDTTLVTLSRWVSGRRASDGGRDHSSHRLVAIGLSERRAVALLCLLAAIGGALGVAIDYLSHSWSSWAILAAVVFLIGMILFAVYLSGIRVYEDDAIPKDRASDGDITPILVEFMYKRRVAEVLLDFCLVTVCYYAAYRMRFEDPEEFMKNFATFLRSLPVVLAAQMIAFFAVGVYRGIWRHFGMSDTITVAKAVFLGAVCAQLVILYAYRFFAYSRAVFAIYGLLLLTAVTVSRASFRLVGEFMRRQKRTGRRVVIYGAGDGGSVVLRELLSSGSADDARLVGFIDDDPRKAGNRVAGYPVLGGYSALSVLVKAASVDAVVISARRIPAERLHNIETLCSESGVRLSRLHIAIESIFDVDEVVPAPSQTAIHQIRP
jgi:UDP-GlcNAc:undecaprenyl-phosphate GlcNAc-1-phosphate transferase